jgi:hypothetical protein
LGSEIEDQSKTQDCPEIATDEDRHRGTQPRRTEAAARQAGASVNYRRNISDHHRPGPDGTALYANQTVLDYTGRNMEEMSGTDFLRRMFHPEDV